MLKTAYDMRISDWSSDLCSSDLTADQHHQEGGIRNQAETCDHRLLSSRLTGRGAGVVALEPPQALTISVGSGPATISASTIRVSAEVVGDRKSTRLNSSH